jgi:SNF2 family DNA or RNA helicase
MEEEQYEADPQRRALFSIVKQCESYSNQIRGILRQWRDKTLKDEPESLEVTLETVPILQEQQKRKQMEDVNQLLGVEDSKDGEEKPPEVDLIKQPENLKFELRSYQLIGLNWLYLLFQQKINGILADESKMYHRVIVTVAVGLGKTIQTIALFALFKLTGEVKKPHLVIVPATGTL